ncbi:hypothetical protein POR1_65 [Pseudomonas phage POR1]|uniref:Uncharacterized protein n=1 Tax=Pseudomonas phage POR1 TaxID=1718594 RepID=A0A0N9SJH9_9CAUD|nr:hypothetical protein POR1_65 [Pseudomonas phage POR1]
MQRVTLDHKDQKHEHDNFSTCTVCGKPFAANEAVHGGFVAHWDCVTPGMHAFAKKLLDDVLESADKQ